MMPNSKTTSQTIGIVLSTVPRYSETFFRNKIKGLQENGFDVVLFVDYVEEGDLDFPCTVIASANYNSSRLKSLSNITKALFKSIFSHPKTSIRFLRLERKDGLSLKNSLRNTIVNEFLLRKKIDWLHFGFGMLSSNRENIAQAIAAQMAVSFRGFDLYLSPLKHKGCYQRLFLKEVKYHVLSHEMKTDLKAQGIQSENIIVIPPAINVDFFQSDGNVKKEASIQLVTVARLHWKKGLEYTLEAIRLLKDSNIDFHYTIIGEGSEYERLQFATHQLNVQDHVTFTGKLPQTEVKKYLESSHIYLQYSIQEGFCNSVLEAQAMGLLCIVSNAEGLSENVLDQKTGWVVPKRQPELLAQKVQEVIRLNPQEKRAIKEVAIKRVREEFNLEQQNEAFFKFYNR
ncbi:glycosyltransferase family 4 protein [Psychroserpens sp. XS_ASV72]|uniref:glycosyltransferase family 4 protein n=1 Tax=Psychroserpens sp. XS_ASV72 TaxID=3241293 RepID=UPI0035162E92